MALISLICLLVLTSSAFGQSGYGSNSRSTPIQQVPKLITIMRDQTVQRPILPPLPLPTQGYGQQQVPLPSQGYGQQQVQQPVQQPITTDWSTPMVQQDISVPYGSSLGTSTVGRKTLPINNLGHVSQVMGLMPMIPQLDQQQVQQVPILTEADMQCRGQRAETVIPIETGHKFIVCLDDSKGVVQHCPKGLYYHPQSQRCERRLGPSENLCASQPCLNGGQCIPTETHYQCQCAPGFDGKTCELDARVCQTQQPCGQSPDTRCQSFRLGAALQYICILQEGLAYGLNPAQAQRSPCQGVDGPQALGVSNTGFIMCDGERMFVESCPGGTIWDDMNKACVWPDMQAVPTLLDQQPAYGQQQVITQSTYGNQWSTPIQQPRPIQMSIPQQLEPVRNVQSYGTRITIPQRPEQPQVPVVSSYGGQVTIPQQSRVVQPIGEQIPIQRPIALPQVINSFGGQRQNNLVPVRQSTGTGY